MTGRLTRGDLEDLAAALHAIKYRGGVALELNATHGDPVKALREGKEIVSRLFLPTVIG